MYFLQQWFSLSDEGLEDVIYDSVAFRRFLDIDLGHESALDATTLHAPSSTKNKDKQRDPEMHSTKKGNQYYFWMKAHIGVDVESGLVHILTTTAAGQTHEITNKNSWLWQRVADSQTLIKI